MWRVTREKAPVKPGAETGGRVPAGRNPLGSAPEEAPDDLPADVPEGAREDPGEGKRKAGLRHSLRAFRHRDYRLFWSGALASNIGTWLSNLAVPFVLFQATHSAFWVGLAALAQFLPGVLVAPLGGSLADRLNRRRVLISTQIAMAVTAGGLWALWVTGAARPPAILAIVALSGLITGLNLPIWQSFVNDLVPREDLASAVALNSLQFNAARSVGPAVAGLLLATLGPGWAFLINGFSFVFVLCALVLIRRGTGSPAPGSARDPGVVRGFVQALRYVRRQPGIRVAILVSVLIGFFGNPVFGFTVVFADEVFHVGALALGALNAALGLGAVLCAPLVSSAGGGLTLARIVRWAMPVHGLAMVGFGLAPGPVVGAFCLVVVGGCFLAVVSSANTSIQMMVTERMRGRVLAIRIMVYSASLPLGSLVQGAISDLIGPRVTVAGAGVVLALVVLPLLRGRGGRLLSRLDDPPDRG
ncbi:MFS transporter [Streptomyces sp. NPDC052042]|uniref:MFS transporter n=1 Tax=Streptomyces sp. NPDC052042 TaxID=3365683 RepID=UPI0037D20220